MQNCDEVIIKIGQYSYLMREVRNKIIAMFRELWGDYRMRYLFGHSVSIVEALMAFHKELEDGTLKVKGMKVCDQDRCIDLEKLLKLLDEYFYYREEKLKYIRELDYCKVNVE